jgi:sugar phosphate isomerase/epimerase
MIKSAVTISLVPEARGGPFVFWDDLAEGCRKAAELGFDAVEVFAPDAGPLGGGMLRALLGDHGLRLAAAGTGAGWLKDKLTLTSPDSAVRRQAVDFIRSMVDAAGPLGAPVIVGSMQGRWRWGDRVSSNDAYSKLADGLGELEKASRAHGVSLLYEPLNRYETDLFTRLTDAAGFIASSHLENTRILADLFHMNIEEQDLAAAVRAAGPLIGHIHFADSNRRPVGLGHTDFSLVAAALRDIGYNGYVSAECLPYPNPDEAARLTIESYRKFCR